MTEKDTYRTIKASSEEVLYKDKNSKFFGYAFPVRSEAEVKTYLAQLKKQHYNARHWCYAYQIGTASIIYRVNDDGEPKNSAGQPIFGQLQSFDVTNTLVVIVRYFGGVKLGVGGLIQAYRTTAQLALENAQIVERTININYRLTFEYKDMNKVMRIIKEKQLTIVRQDLGMDCQIQISVRKNHEIILFEIFNHLFGVRIEKVND